MKIPIFKTKKNEDWDFFSKLGKKSPKFHWEWGQISALENTKKSLDQWTELNFIMEFSWKMGFFLFKAKHAKNGNKLIILLSPDEVGGI